MPTYTIIIPDFTPCLLNKLLGSNRFKAARLKRDDAQMIGFYALKANVPRATGKRRVEIEVTVAGPGRTIDPDGVLKSLLDALVTAGMLVDDSSKWCEWETPIILRGTARETKLILEDLPATEETAP